MEAPNQLMNDLKKVVYSHICPNCIEPSRPAERGLGKDFVCSDMCEMVTRILDRVERKVASA